MTKIPTLDRRRFIRRSLAATLGGFSLYSAPGLLGTLQAATHAKGFADFKALVCVFLYGGNDGFNTVVPLNGPARTNYLAGRGATLALQAEQLEPLAIVGPAPSDGCAYGWQRATQAGGTQPLIQAYQDGELAIVANVGTLIQPTSQAEVNQAGYPLPPQLYSHNDQQFYWQTCGGTGSQGWAGRMADLLHTANVGATVPMSFTVAGESVLLRGSTARQYAINPWPRAAERMTFLEAPEAGSAARRAVFADLIAQNQQAHVFERTYARSMRQALDTYANIRDAIALSPPIATTFPATALGRQLEMVAHLIAARQPLNLRRQVFFVQQGGYDTHDGQSTEHPALLSQLAQALGAFRAAMIELGVNDAVASFTASDFGRTLTSNGDGSDHGWGSHHFAMGGAVEGGFYGQMPNLASAAQGGTLDAGWGQIIPTTSVEQYAATLGRWFGLSEADLADVLPNLGNFSSGDLGFMA